MYSDQPGRVYMDISELTSEDSSYDDFSHQEYRNHHIDIDDSFFARMKRAMKNALAGNRENIQKQKIQAELVRKYINNKKKQPPSIRRILRDFFESWYY